jgi:hypothetical protein
MKEHASFANQPNNQNNKQHMPTYTQTEPKEKVTYFVEPGVYEVEVENAVEKRSQSGNDMIKLDVKVILRDGTDGPTCWDYLVFTPKAAWKIDAFRASCGEAVIPGEPCSIEAQNLIGKRGLAYIGEEEKKEDSDHRFNKLDRWIFGDDKTNWFDRRKEGAHIKAKADGYAPKSKTEDGDDIPF